jgi:membrane associated rhomboid family serine protease
MNAPIPNPPQPSTRQPVFNLPVVVSGLIALLIAIEAGRDYLLDVTGNVDLIVTFAFVPFRETSSQALIDVPWIDAGARVWTFVTYAFLHGGWAHVLMNSLWLAAFGTPVARRFGAVRFLLYSGIGAGAGAALHLAIYPHDQVPLVGASAAISAMMAGACRFAFQPAGPMWALGVDRYRQPASSFREMLRDRRVLSFIGIWFVVNLAFGLTGGGGLSSSAIAWEAHIGGFVAGLLLFGTFDPVSRRSV